MEGFSPLQPKFSLEIERDASTVPCFLKSEHPFLRATTFSPAPLGLCRLQNREALQNTPRRLAGPILWFCKRDRSCDPRTVVQYSQSRRSRARPNAPLEYRTMLSFPRALPFDSVICAARKRLRSGPFAALRIITSNFHLNMACHEQAAERSRRSVEWLPELERTETVDLRILNCTLGRRRRRPACPATVRRIPGAHPAAILRLLSWS